MAIDLSFRSSKAKRSLIRLSGCVAVFLFFGAAVGVGVSGCGTIGGSGCRDGMGCESRMIFDLAEPFDTGHTYNIRACVGEFCRTADIFPSGTDDDDERIGTSSNGISLLALQGRIFLALPEDREWEGARISELVINSSSLDREVEIRREVEIKRVQPNGEGCPPICWQGEISL